MQLCQEIYKISHSHFLGGPAEWTQADRDKAIWWWLRSNTKCANCGTRPDEWDEAVGGDRWAYTVDTVRCRGCEVKETMPPSEVEKMGKGVYVILKKNDPELWRRYKKGDADG